MVLDTLLQGLGKARCNFGDQSNEAVTDDIEMLRAVVMCPCNVVSFFFMLNKKTYQQSDSSRASHLSLFPSRTFRYLVRMLWTQPTPEV